MTTNPRLWRPTDARVATTQMTVFTRLAETETGRRFADYSALHRWSVEEPGSFWQLVWDYTGVIASRPADRPVEHVDRFPGARWFPGARLNFAENLLRHDDERTALIGIRETGERTAMTHAELRRAVASLAACLRDRGVRPGDRVAGWLPNLPETVAAMLATASVGAVWSSCSPDFGVGGALDRFGQIAPRVLFACDGYTYAGRPFRIVEKVQEVATRVPSIEDVIWVDVLGAPPPGATRYDALVRDDTVPLVFEPRDFADPLYVLYSSGTTGAPKCIVHGIGGTLLQHLKEHALHVDLRAEDVLFFFTTCGWMMWNWLASGLASGAALVLFDGSPFHPGAGALFDLAERERITVFGVGARYLSSVEKAGLVPRETHDLGALRCLLSTGSPLLEQGFRYVYRDIAADVHLASIAGGTDLISCFVLGNPNLPVYEGEIQCAGLGMAVEVWDENGAPLARDKGELVCSRPFPSCPIGFWNDPGDEKFLDAYFRRFPGVWAHGDFAEITPRGGFVIHGRSDAVLNPGGVRIGTAEIYRQVEELPEVQEACCIGQSFDGDVRVVLFVVLDPLAVLDDALCEKIRARIRTGASPRHVPAKIVQVADLPRTLSGKIAELAVRDVVHGRPVKNTSALANPESLALFAGLEILSS